MNPVFRSLLIAAAIAAVSAPAMAWNLNDAASAVQSMQGNTGSGQPVVENTTPQTAGLLNTLGSGLNVTPVQAAGGASAMLGMAKNNLSDDQFSQLTSKVPGLEQLAGANALIGSNGLGKLLGQSANSQQQAALGSALGDVQNTQDLDKAFGALGMNSSMIGQFAPLILQYLGQQGVGGSVLQSLGSVWGVK